MNGGRLREKIVWRKIKIAKLDDEWWNIFRGSFETEEDVFEFIFERVDTSDFEDSYIDVGEYMDPNECFKETAEDKRMWLYDLMMKILEEAQQYRANGTLEECQKAVIEAKFRNAAEKQLNELVFYMDLLETGIDVELVRSYMGDEAADIMLDFCESYGLA